MAADLTAQDTVTEIARPSSGLALSFAEMTMRVAQLDQFYREVMQEGTDYGKIPGTDKPTLYQPGAQMLDQIFGYAPFFEILPSSVIDWDRPIPFFHYVVMCRLVSRRTGEVVAQGIGSANSMEDRYRWRRARQTCPQCSKETIGRSKAEFGGGYFCNAKNGGCGTSFKANTDGARRIDKQPAGRVENEDTASLENTLSKMAQKRAHIAATLNATGASRIFTQDIEDLPQFQQAMQATVVESTSVTVSHDREPAAPLGTAPAGAAGADAAPARTPSAPTATPSTPEGTGTAAGPETVQQRWARLVAEAERVKLPTLGQVKAIDPKLVSDSQLQRYAGTLEKRLNELQVSAA